MQKIKNYINSLHKISNRVLIIGTVIALLYFIVGIVFYLNRMSFEDILFANSCYRAAISSSAAMCIVTLIFTFASDYGLKYIDRR